MQPYSDGQQVGCQADSNREILTPIMAQAYAKRCRGWPNVRQTRRVELCRVMYESACAASLPQGRSRTSLRVKYLILQGTADVTSIPRNVHWTAEGGTANKHVIESREGYATMLCCLFL